MDDSIPENKSQCSKCQNYINNIKCKAFPKGIPENILIGEFDHTKKHPNQDNNTLFEPIEEQLRYTKK